MALRRPPSGALTAHSRLDSIVTNRYRCAFLAEAASNEDCHRLVAVCRLLRMLLTESVLLAMIGGVGGAYVAWRVPILIVRVIQFAPAYSLKPDWVVFTYLAGITLVAGCLAGLAPIAESLKTDLAESLKGGEDSLSAMSETGALSTS